MTGPWRSPKDSPMSFQADVEEFKVICKKLGCHMHYAPSMADNPPDTIIVTNGEILAEQSTTQQILETLLLMDKFMWDGKVFTYGPDATKIEADSFIEAVFMALAPEKVEGV